MTVPVHLQSFVNEAAEQLRVGAVCIAERHTMDDGRLIVRALLGIPGLVHTFFVEYDPAGGLPMGERVNATLKEYRRCLSQVGRHHRLASAGREISDCFAALVPTDARPNLEELALLALNSGARVVAADPLIKKGTDAIIDRNEATAKAVYEHMESMQAPHLRGALLLWGAGHFDNQYGIQVLLRRKNCNVHVFDVSNVYRSG